MTRRTKVLFVVALLGVAATASGFAWRRRNVARLTVIIHQPKQ